MRKPVGGLALALASVAALAAASERVLVEGVLVRVNERIVTVSDFSERVRSEIAQMPQAPENQQELSEFAEMLLQEVVNELVILERATEKRVEVDEQMVDQAVANLRKENNLEDDEAWEQALQSSGLTADLLRERYRRSMTMQRAVQGEVRPVEVTEEELRRQYESDKERFSVPAKVELQQVFLSGGAETDPATLRRAEAMVERVRGGADLKAEAILAGAELQDLGAIPVEDCRPDLRSALDPLPEGGVTEPLAVPGGLQIVRLVERIPAGYQPFEEVAEELRRQRSAESYESQTRGLVEKLRQDYLVEVHEDRLALVLENLAGDGR
ncbi:MAG TPA: peptidyl-prolyl cis-trans isomerase [Chondromyces sp.]|nr:peptidyl-prolyl cis-trans isomerase [Chondromyces sp.]